MVSVKGSFTSPPRLQAPQYHAIASRTLQKRFVHSCVCSMVISYGCSYIIGAHHGFWYLFPWSWTGLRAIFIFAAIFPVYLVRKANLHVFPATRPNIVSHYSSRLFSANALRAFLAYTVSAAILLRLYLNNCGPSSTLSILVSHKAYELPRLNERWLYLHVLAFWLACVSAMRHVLEDLDFLDIPTVKIPVPNQLEAMVPSVAIRVLETSVASSFSAPLVYLLIRRPLYQNVLKIVKLFYRLPKSSALPGWPVNFSLACSSLLFSVIAAVLWTTLNALFAIYLSQGPIHKGRLLSEKSMQADETLLSGLRNSNKPLTQLLAFEELKLIATEDNFRSRRVSIFEAGSPEAITWRAILESGLKPLTDATLGLKNALQIGTGQQSAPSSSTAPTRVLPPGTSPVQVYQANIFKTGVQKKSALDNLKSQASSVAENQKQIAEVQKITTNAENLISTKTQSFLAPYWKYIPKDELNAAYRSAQNQFIDIKVLLLAIESLTNFLMNSMEEDTYGRVHKDVTKVLLEFLSLLQMTSSYVHREASKIQNLVLEEPNALMSALHASISKVGLAFEDFVDFAQNPTLNNQIQSYKQQKSAS